MPDWCTGHCHPLLFLLSLQGSRHKLYGNDHADIVSTVLELLYPNPLIPCRTVITTVTVNVTSPAVKLKRAGFEAATTIYAGSPVTIVGPDATSVVLNRRMVEARATSAPPPTCLPQYRAGPARLTSACNCLSITSSTLSTVSTAPTTIQVSFLLFFNPSALLVTMVMWC